MQVYAFIKWHDETTPISYKRFYRKITIIFALATQHDLNGMSEGKGQNMSTGAYILLTYIRAYLALTALAKVDLVKSEEWKNKAIYVLMN